MTPAPRSSAPAAGERGLRSDAQRNLERIIRAARGAFVECGVGVGVAEIARRAGVGNATIFRRFPAKDDLIVAILEASLREHVGAARAAVEDLPPDQALHRFCAVMVRGLMDDRALLDALPARLFSEPRLQPVHGEGAALAERLIARARESGAIRDDVTGVDVGLLVTWLARLGAALEPAAPGLWGRYLVLVLDGLRPGGTPLPVAAPAWSMLCTAGADPTAPPGGCAAG